MIQNNQFIPDSCNYLVLGLKGSSVPTGGHNILYQWKFWVVTLSRAVTQRQDVWVTDKLLTKTVT